MFVRILDVQPNRVSVGGVRSIEGLLHRKGQVATHDFVGCIMEFAVNGRPLEPSQALSSHGVLDRSVNKRHLTPSFTSADRGLVESLKQCFIVCLLFTDVPG